MTIAVKYCGGCNPRFDRMALTERLKTDYPGLAVINVHGSDGIPPELAVVICGCQSRCAEHRDFDGAAGKIIVGGPEDFPALFTALERLNP